MARQQTNTPTKRPGMIYCERCGEDYADTYRRCPFCDERPGRRIDERRYKSRNPLQVAVLVGSLILILAAAFIVFQKLSPLFLEEKDPVDPTPGTSQTQPETPTPEVTPPEVTDPIEDPVVSTVPAQVVVLSKEDITLKPGETYPLLASVSPANATDAVVWTSSHPDILSVTDGTVVNNNTTGEKVAVTVTATAGGVSAECIVRCNSAQSVSNPGPATQDPAPSQNPSTPSISGKTEARVTASGGLNIRSGPGSNYEKIASADNGASVTILEDAGNGWYKIDYGNGKVGYASSQYIQPK